MSLHACIINKSDSSILARAPADQIIRLEGNYYFPSDGVNTGNLEISDRVYTCPQKGTCQWIDMKTDKGYINDVAWVYQQPKSQYQNIARHYGFYADHRHYQYQECD